MLKKKPNQQKNSNETEAFHPLLWIFNNTDLISDFDISTLFNLSWVNKCLNKKANSELKDTLKAWNKESHQDYTDYIKDIKQRTLLVNQLQNYCRKNQIHFPPTLATIFIYGENNNSTKHILKLEQLKQFVNHVLRCSRNFDTTIEFGNWLEKEVISESRGISNTYFWEFTVRLYLHIMQLDLRQLSQQHQISENITAQISNAVNKNIHALRNGFEEYSLYLQSDSANVLSYHNSSQCDADSRNILDSIFLEIKEKKIFYTIYTLYTLYCDVRRRTVHCSGTISIEDLIKTGCKKEQIPYENNISALRQIKIPILTILAQRRHIKYNVYKKLMRFILNYYPKIFAFGKQHIELQGIPLEDIDLEFVQPPLHTKGKINRLKLAHEDNRVKFELISYASNAYVGTVNYTALLNYGLVQKDLPLDLTAREKKINFYVVKYLKQQGVINYTNLQRHPIANYFRLILSYKKLKQSPSPENCQEGDLKSFYIKLINFVSHFNLTEHSFIPQWFSRLVKHNNNLNTLKLFGQAELKNVDRRMTNIKNNPHYSTPYKLLLYNIENVRRKLIQLCLSQPPVQTPYQGVLQTYITQLTKEPFNTKLVTSLTTMAIQLPKAAIYNYIELLIQANMPRNFLPDNLEYQIQVLPMIQSELKLSPNNLKQVITGLSDKSFCYPYATALEVHKSKLPDVDTLIFVLKQFPTAYRKKWNETFTEYHCLLYFLNNYFIAGTKTSWELLLDINQSTYSKIQTENKQFLEKKLIVYKGLESTPHWLIALHTPLKNSKNKSFAQWLLRYNKNTKNWNKVFKVFRQNYMLIIKDFINITKLTPTSKNPEIQSLFSLLEKPIPTIFHKKEYINKLVKANVFYKNFRVSNDGFPRSSDSNCIIHYYVSSGATPEKIIDFIERKLLFFTEKSEYAFWIDRFDTENFKLLIKNIDPDEPIKIFTQFDTAYKLIHIFNIECFENILTTYKNSPRFAKESFGDFLEICKKANPELKDLSFLECVFSESMLHEITTPGQIIKLEQIRSVLKNLRIDTNIFNVNGLDFIKHILSSNNKDNQNEKAIAKKLLALMLYKPNDVENLLKKLSEVKNNHIDLLKKLNTLYNQCREKMGDIPEYNHLFKLPAPALPQTQTSIPKRKLEALNISSDTNTSPPHKKSKTTHPIIEPQQNLVTSLQQLVLQVQQNPPNNVSDLNMALQLTQKLYMQLAQLQRQQLISSQVNDPSPHMFFNNPLNRQTQPNPNVGLTSSTNTNIQRDPQNHEEKGSNEDVMDVIERKHTKK